jgi:ABC-2 type transport system permease protein
VRDFLAALALELRTLRADRGALMVMGLAVLVYPLVYPIPYLPQVARDIPVVVVDGDHSALSRRLARMADATEQVRVSAQARSLDEAEDLVRGGRAGGVLVIPAGFERALVRGQQPTIGAYADASYILVYRQVLTGLSAAAGTFSAGVEIRRLRAAGRSSAAALAARDPIPVLVRPLYNAAGGYGSYVVPGVLVLVLQQTLLIGIGLLAGTARERGADPRLLAFAGRRRDALAALAGRACAYVALYSVYALYVFGAVFPLLHMPMRASAWELGVFLGPYLLACVMLGLAMAPLFRTREGAMQTLFVSSLPLVFMAGFSWPTEALPGAVRALAALAPSTTGSAGVLRLTQSGASLADVGREWGQLWLLAALYGALALASARRAARRLNA